MSVARAIREHLKLSARLAAEFDVPTSARLMLLDLALCRIEGLRVDLTGAKIASGLTGGGGPYAAIRKLEATGLVYRVPDPDDRRRSWLYITDLGLARVEAVFGAGSFAARAA